MPPYDKTSSDELYHGTVAPSSLVGTAASTWNCVSSGSLLADPASSSTTTTRTPSSFRTSHPPPPKKLIATSSIDSNASSSTTSSTSSSSSSSSITSTSTTATTSYLSSSSSSLVPRHHFGERLAVEGSLRAILLCLEHHGINQNVIQELHRMIPQHRYLRVMARAEEYTECCLLCSGSAVQDDLDAIIELFIGGWKALIHFARCLYKDAYRAYSANQNKQWEEFIVQQSTNMTVRQKMARQRRTLAEWQTHPLEQTQLKEKLWQMTRSKRECEKGLVLAQEWGRCMRAQAKEAKAKS